MSLRGALAALAVIGVVEASVIIPKVSYAGQLADTMAATSVNGHLNSIPRTNIGSAQRARKTAAAVQQYRQDGKEAFANGQTAVQPHSDRAAPAFDERKPVMGKAYSTDGIVIFDEDVRGQRVVFIVRIAGPNKFQVMGFRLSDPSVPKFEKHEQVRVVGRYAAKIKEPETGSMVHGFDAAVFERVQGSSPQSESGAGASAAGGPKEAEKQSFDSVMKGWAFRGTAEVGGQTTGVFVNEDRARYVKAGDELEGGVKVVSLDSGRARVAVEGYAVDVMPW